MGLPFVVARTSDSMGDDEGSLTRNERESGRKVASKYGKRGRRLGGSDDKRAATVVNTVVPCTVVACTVVACTVVLNIVVNINAPNGYPPDSHCCQAWLPANAPTPQNPNAPTPPDAPNRTTR